MAGHTPCAKIFEVFFLVFFQRMILHIVQYFLNIYVYVYVIRLRALKGAKHYDICVYVIRALKGLKDKTLNVTLEKGGMEVGDYFCEVAFVVLSRY